MAQVAATASFRERERAMAVDAAVLQDAVQQLQGELLEQARSLGLQQRPSSLSRYTLPGCSLTGGPSGQSD
jgi:hypothetical protein